MNRCVYDQTGGQVGVDLTKTVRIWKNMLNYLKNIT